MGDLLPCGCYGLPDLLRLWALVHRVRYGLLVPVAPLQAPGAEGFVPTAFLGALEVAVVYCDEQVVPLLLWDRPVNYALCQLGKDAEFLISDARKW